jgi:hypothetical protein
MLKKVIFLVWVLFPMYTLTAQGDQKGPIQLTLNAEASYQLLESNQDLRKIEKLLELRQTGVLDNNGLNIGTQLIAITDYQKSTVNSKFGYLMRHPTAANQVGTAVSEAVIHSAQVSLTGSINPWLSTHIELLYNPEQSFGSGTITSLERNQIQIRRGFAVFGDLNRFPLYGAIGKMDTPFGQTGSVSPFTNSSMWHAFGGLAYGMQVGYKKNGLSLALMLIQGGAQFRAANTPVGDNTNVPSKLNNFSVDLNYRFGLSEVVGLQIGGSYLYGSPYCQDFPVFHFNPCSENNPAYSLYGNIQLGNRLYIQGSYAQTIDVWKGTHNPTPPLDIFEASKASSLDVGGRYDLFKTAQMAYSLSAEFSNFRAGPDGSPWERQNQWILGFSGLYKKSSKFFVELFHTQGFVPLNFISGSADNAPFPPGTTHSTQEANSIGIVAGVQLTL